MLRWCFQIENVFAAQGLGEIPRPVLDDYSCPYFRSFQILLLNEQRFEIIGVVEQWGQTMFWWISFRVKM